MKSMMRNIALALSLLTLTLAAKASDLDQDLKVPFLPMSNPFQGLNAQALQAGLAQQVQTLLQTCASATVHISKTSFPVLDSAKVIPSCAGDLVLGDAGAVHLSNGGVVVANGAEQAPGVDNELRLRVGNTSLTVVSWDGSQSDGGDEQALAVYNDRGDRIAVYPDVFVDGNVLDGLAYVLGAQIPQVLQRQ